MLEKLLELLLALVLGATGLANAAERFTSTPQSGGDDGLELAHQMAALQAGFGLARAVEARGQGADTEEVTTAEAVDGLAQAADALTQAMDNAPEQADAGLQRAWDAVTTSPANDRPAAAATGGAPAGVPLIVGPPATTPPVPAPPMDPGPSAEVPGRP